MAESAPEVARSKRGLIETIRLLKKNQISIYGPQSFSRDLVVWRMGRLHSVFVNRPEWIEHVLLGNHRNYTKSPFTRQILEPALGRGLLTSEGDFWRRQRRIAAPAFHHKRIMAFAEVMAEEARATAAGWEAGGRRDVAADMMALTLRIIARTMFSTAVEDGRTIEAVSRAMDTMLRLGDPSLFDLLGLPEWLPRWRPRALVGAIAALDRVIAGILAERRRRDDPGEDLLGMLLSMRDDETGEGMTDAQLRDEVMTMFLAGHETTANALAWVWYLLGRHPVEEARLHAELDAVLGERDPGFADLPGLVYTRQVFEEAMRLYPPAHTISRQAIGPDRLGDTVVPAGAVVTIAPWVTHRNPKLWPDPERFDPDRFLPEAVKARPRFAYLPFGGGPRICIGASFAMTEGVLVLATLARRFRPRLPEGQVVQPVGQITLRPEGGLPMQVDRRPGPALPIVGAAGG